MTLTNTQLATLILIPGYAEVLETKANSNGNTAWCGIARGVRYARNALLTGVTLTIIGVAGTVFNGNSTDAAYRGLGLTLLAGVKLCESSYTLLRIWPGFEIAYGPIFKPS